jgi:hypothetical protein
MSSTWPTVSAFRCNNSEDFFFPNTVVEYYLLYTLRGCHASENRQKDANHSFSSEPFQNAGRGRST